MYFGRGGGLMPHYSMELDSHPVDVFFGLPLLRLFWAFLRLANDATTMEFLSLDSRR